MARTAALLALLATVAAGLTGCGETGVDRPNVSATLILDGAPSAADVGIYVASGSATFAVLDIHDLAIAREHGDDVVAVMAIVQLPSATRARAVLRAHSRVALAKR